MKTLLHTAFFTAFVSYGVFAFADYVRPGFVSYQFSVHWLLLAAVVFGVLSVVLRPSMGAGKSGRLFTYVTQLMLSCALFFLVWSEGAVFGDARIFLALVAMLLPWVVKFEEGE